MPNRVPREPVEILATVTRQHFIRLVEDTTIEEWNRQIAVNLGGVFLCSRFFLPFLRKTKGNIINMASVNGFFVEPIAAGYCATKAGIMGLTKAMAIDHGKEGIRVNCICPGYIDSGLAESYFQAQPDPAAARAAAGKLHALWRIGQPEEVARVAIFLASDEASFVTGSRTVPIQTQFRETHEETHLTDILGFGYIQPFLERFVIPIVMTPAAATVVKPQLVTYL